MDPVDSELRERGGDLVAFAVLAVVVTGLVSAFMTFAAGAGCVGDQGDGPLCGERGQPLTVLLAFGPPASMVALSVLAILRRSKRLLIASALLMLAVALFLPLLVGE